ncbi:MAG: hypothetical protein ISS15_02510 [Alphaproteobacteria bacterium]|nr:hypothetical protein [Alphaproteobacteria bacterium]MBL6938447.1 hypothetical protein [Alphaproteobacteria bacterium]MBL7096506.1 hypothetical protein [Alphaproteobacteria bacterium]
MTDHAQPGAAAAEPVPFEPDETYDLRKQAAQTMLNYLEKSEAMLARCEIVMRDKGSDQFTAANAAVRLMKAGGDITKALMLAAFGETRHRSISEKVEQPRPQRTDQVAQDIDAATALMARELRALTEEIVSDAEKDRLITCGAPAPQCAELPSRGDPCPPNAAT